MELTEKQKKFASEYYKEPNATKAAKRAGYSNKTAYSIGHENLRKPEIKKEIEKIRQEISSKSNITATDIINEVRLIHAISINKGDLKTSLKALELLGKHLGCWETVSINEAELLESYNNAISIINNPNQ